MNKILEVGLIIVAVTSVAVADVIIKKVALHVTSLSQAIKEPLMLLIVALYIVQILIFTYVFIKRAELGIVGIIQTALYAIIVIGSGILFFQEKISLIQGVGIGFAIVGVICMNL
jgi:drug/metabolite transporter (DMT)-like permease